MLDTGEISPGKGLPRAGLESPSQGGFRALWHLGTRGSQGWPWLHGRMAAFNDPMDSITLRKAVIHHLSLF